MNIPAISESEWLVMEVLWQDGPCSSSEVIKALRQRTGWADNTVRTLLARLVEKGAAKTKDHAEGRTYQAAVKRERCVQAESATFLQRVFQGSTKPLLLHFVSQASLSPADVAELKRLLDEAIDSEPQS